MAIVTLGLTHVKNPTPRPAMLVCSMPLKGPAHIDVYCTDDTELGQAISSACLSSVAPEPMASCFLLLGLSFCQQESEGVGEN